MGAFVGGLLALGWVALDWTRILYADWLGLTVLFFTSSLVGAVIGFFRPVKTSVLAKSMDLRAGLKDRLDTAIDEHGESIFQSVQAEDAEQSLAGVTPSALYPVRFGRWQTAALAAAVLAASAFLLGNSPALRGPKSDSERSELKEAGQKVERIAKPLEKDIKPAPAAQGNKKLAGELNKFAKELEQGKLNKEEAIRKANELAQKSEDESKTKAEETLRKTEEAESALGKFQKLKLEEAGVKPEDLRRLDLSPQQQAALDQIMKDEGFSSPESKFSDSELKEMGVSRTAEKLAQLSPEQREQLRQAAQRRQEALQKEIDRIDKMSPSERAKLEQEMEALRKEQQELQKLMESLKLSEDTLKALRELMQSEEMQKLRELMSKMKQEAQQTGQGQKLTKEQIDQLKQQLDELAKAMKDPALKEQLMQKLRDAIQQLENGQMSLSAAMQMMDAMGLGGSADGMPGASGPGSDDQFADTGKVVKSDEEMKTKGKGSATRVQGQWNEKAGDQWSVTVKAPTQVGNRSSVPYQSVMPQYRKAAEKALSGGKIPKDKEKRVREYFDSLSGGR